MPGTSKQYRLHGVLLPGSTWITELTDLTPAANIEFLAAYAGAATVPSFQSGQSAAPDVTFSTPQIKTILDECTDGDGISLADYSASNVDLAFREVTSFSTRTPIATPNHIIIRARRSMMVWQRIQANQDQPATIECRIIPTWDGTNNPLIGLGSQSIAANLLVQQQFTLGPFKLNGSWIDGVQGWTLDQNHTITEVRSDGETYQRFVCLERSDPVFTVDTPDLAQWVSPGPPGVQVTAIAAYLTKRKSDSTLNETDATAVHIKFSNNDNPCGLAGPETGSGGVNDAASVSLRIATRISAAATLHPLTVNTASAIS